MGWQGTLRALEAARRRQQREAQRRQRELERQAKEMSKMSQAAQASLEVETFENRLEVLLSIHKEQGVSWDWIGLATALPPPQPQLQRNHELRARQTALVAAQGQKTTIEEAQKCDELVFNNAKQDYESQISGHEKLRSFARQILAHDHKAYIEALVEISPLKELSDLGSLLHFTVHTDKLIQCDLKVSGIKVIPTEAKTLTASGRVSVKTMAKARFHEIYQDYVCGCMLRVGREVFAVLPVETLLITASVDLLDSRTGGVIIQPILSAIMPRKKIEQLNFEQLDPSDAMEGFQHSGDFKASRKDSAFRPIPPLTPSDLEPCLPKDMNFFDLIENVKKMREQLSAQLKELIPDASNTIQLNA